MIFPIPLQSKVLCLVRPAISILVDLATYEDEIWIALVADAKHERPTDEIVGYLRLQKRVTQQPGLTTFAVVEARSADSPPPNLSPLTTIFQWPSLADYELLPQFRSASHG